VSSLGVYGIIIAGWASNSKYPFYSALRAAAQMVSYEVSIGFILISVVLWAGSFNIGAIVEAQRSHLWITNGFGFNPLFLPMAVMFLISSMAETARAPFDLTEAESELVAGYQTEYSSMSFALFWLGEYANVILMCTLNALLFWGGYLPPIDWAPLYVIPGILWLFLKILIFFFIFSWVKATVPRYRYDQLMRLGWKIFLPLSLIWVVLVSGYLMLTRYNDQPLDLVTIAQAQATDAPKTASSQDKAMIFGSDDIQKYYVCKLRLSPEASQNAKSVIGFAPIRLSFFVVNDRGREQWVTNDVPDRMIYEHPPFVKVRASQSGEMLKLSWAGGRAVDASLRWRDNAQQAGDIDVIAAADQFPNLDSAVRGDGKKLSPEERKALIAQLERSSVQDPYELRGLCRQEKWK
jgi:NADH dehydrogenase